MARIIIGVLVLLSLLMQLSSRNVQDYSAGCGDNCNLSAMEIQDKSEEMSGRQVALIGAGFLGCWLIYSGIKKRRASGGVILEKNAGKPVNPVS